MNKSLICPLCESECKAVNYEKGELLEPYMQHVNIYCTNDNCPLDLNYKDIPFDKAIERFTTRPKNKYKEMWEKLKWVLRFSFDQGIMQNDYDGGYKAGIEKCHREIRQIEKELNKP